MLALKYLLMTGGFGVMLAALGILGYDLYREILYRRALATPGATVPAEPEWRWRTSLALGFLAWGPILLALSIVVVPSGTAGVPFKLSDRATEPVGQAGGVQECDDG